MLDSLRSSTRCPQSATDPPALASSVRRGHPRGRRARMRYRCPYTSSVSVVERCPICCCTTFGALMAACGRLEGSGCGRARFAACSSAARALPLCSDRQGSAAVGPASTGIGRRPSDVRTSIFPRIKGNTKLATDPIDSPANHPRLQRRIRAFPTIAFAHSARPTMVTVNPTRNILTSFDSRLEDSKNRAARVFEEPIAICSCAHPPRATDANTLSPNFNRSRGAHLSPLSP